MKVQYPGGIRALTAVCLDIHETLPYLLEVLGLPQSDPMLDIHIKTAGSDYDAATDPPGVASIIYGGRTDGSHRFSFSMTSIGLINPPSNSWSIYANRLVRYLSF